MIFLLHYIQLSLWTCIYLYQKNKSPIIYNLIIKKIKDSGCIAIKFTQWLIPILESEYEMDSERLQEIEDLYENCHGESVGYMKQIYKQEFRKEFNQDYENKGIIGTGSIGQVYKITDKDNKEYALKILHPNNNLQILIFTWMIKLLYFIPFIKKWTRYYIPINLNDFISEFMLQTDLTNEANNCLRFYEMYKDNSMIIIPKIHKISKNILIMSYEEGETYDDMELSDYKKSKVVILLKCLIRDMESFNNFVHGDIHKGNWKVRIIQDKEPAIVLYDFGFCWEITDEFMNVLPLLDIYCAKLINVPPVTTNQYSSKLQELTKEDHENDILLDILYHFFHKIYSKDYISQEIKIYKTINSMDQLIKTILRFSKENDVLISSCLFQCLIIINQMHKYISSSEKVDDILDIITYCETHNIFPKYKEYLKNVKRQDNYIKAPLFEYTDILQGLMK